MKKTLLFVLCTLTSAMAGSKGDLNVTDHLQLDPQEQGKPVVANISFSNTGNSDLNISEVKTPCGCTKVKLDKTSYKPGEAGSFEVIIQTARLSGTYDKNLKIISDDGDEPEKKVRITFDLKPTTSVAANP